jgi:hypothetical protein
VHGLSRIGRGQKKDLKNPRFFNPEQFRILNSGQTQDAIAKQNLALNKGKTNNKS